MNTSLVEYLAGTKAACDALIEEEFRIIDACKKIHSALAKGAALFSCGNGGSGCQAMHLTEELLGRYKKERRGFRAFHLMDSGTITCWANDYSYEDIFARQVQALMKSEDVLLVMSTSGNSENILRALKTAKTLGASSIALLGKDGGRARLCADIPIIVKSQSTSHIQEIHLAIVHFICEFLEQELLASPTEERPFAP